MKPRIGSILYTDWPALFCLMGLPVIWLICAQLPFIRREGGFGMAEALAIAAASPCSRAACSPGASCASIGSSPAAR